MPFQLSIRHQGSSDGDPFKAALVQSFDVPSVRVGCGAGMDCTLEGDSAMSGALFTITESAPGHALLHLEPEVAVFINREPAKPDQPLFSGDEIRVEQWTLRFQRHHKGAALARHSDLTTLAAKALVAVIIAAELGVVFWLPYQMRTASTWETQVARQRVQLRLDKLRFATPPEGEPADLSQVEKAGLDAVHEQLNGLARYLRSHEEQLTREQWRRAGEDLAGYERIIARLTDGSATRAVPPVSVEAGVRCALGKGRDEH